MGWETTCSPRTKVWEHYDLVCLKRTHMFVTNRLSKEENSAEESVNSCWIGTSLSCTHFTWDSNKKEEKISTSVFKVTKQKIIRQQWQSNLIRPAMSLTQSDVHVTAALWHSVVRIMTQCTRQSTPAVHSQQTTTQYNYISLRQLAKWTTTATTWLYCVEL